MVRLKLDFYRQKTHISVFAFIKNASNKNVIFILVFYKTDIADFFEKFENYLYPSDFYLLYKIRSALSKIIAGIYEHYSDFPNWNTSEEDVLNVDR